MLTLKINKKDIEIIEREDFVRGTVGANFNIAEISNWWLSEDMLTEIAPPEFDEYSMVGLKVAFVFKCYGKTIETTVVDEFADNISTIPLYSNDDLNLVTIPHEMFATSGSFKIGFYCKIYYVKSEEDYNNKNYNYLVTPTLWSEDIKVNYGTDTDCNKGDEEPAYTPTELEQFKAEVETEFTKKQDKLTAGENVTITGDNVISAKGGDVDQTYKSYSSNAQSGKAVAEALEEGNYARKPNVIISPTTDYRVPYINTDYPLPAGSVQRLDFSNVIKLEDNTYPMDNYVERNIPVRSAEGNIFVANNGSDVFSKKADNHSVAVGELKYVQTQLSNTIANLGSSLTNLVNAKTITTIGVIKDCKYTFDWNAMYFFKSNTGKADITLLDSDGNNIIGSLKCSYGLLILPEQSFAMSQWTIEHEEGGMRKEAKLHGLFAGMTDKATIITTDKIQMLQFDLDPDKSVNFTPVDESVIVYKIKF